MHSIQKVHSFNVQEYLLKLRFYLMDNQLEHSLVVVR